MPADLTDLATPTLIRRGAGDLFPLHPGPPPGDRRHRPAQERCLHPVQHLCHRCGPGGPAGRPRREQAGGEPGDRRPGEPGLPGAQPRPVRPSPDHPRADRARGRGRGGGGTRHRGDRRAAGDAGVARRDRGHAGRVDGAGRDQDRDDDGRDRSAATSPALPAVQPDLPGPGHGRRVGRLHLARLLHLRLRRRWRLRVRQTRRGEPPPGAGPRPRSGHDLPLRARRRRPLRGVEQARDRRRQPPVALMGYGLREGSHLDPDGNEIRFGSEPEE